MKNIFIIMLILLFASGSYALTREQKEIYRFQEEEQYQRHKITIREVRFEGQILSMTIRYRRMAYNPYGISIYNYRPVSRYRYRRRYRRPVNRYRGRCNKPQYYGGLIPYH